MRNVKLVLNIHIASSIPGRPEPEPFEICAHEPAPTLIESADYVGDGRRFYAEEAALIASTMFGSLPGGTIDALLVEFLRRKLSVLQVPLPAVAHADLDSARVLIDAAREQIAAAKSADGQLGADARESANRMAALVLALLGDLK